MIRNIILLNIFISSALMAQTVTIDWYRINFPPSLVYTPNDKELDNSGYSDKARTIAIDNMKNYKHKYLPISVKKVMKLAKKHKTKTICFAGLNKNPQREKFLLFSKPHLLSLPNQIIARKDNTEIKKFLNKDGQLSLDKLLSSDYKVSVASGRSYSPAIDKILKNSKNVIEPTSKDISNSYIKQVVSKRVDFTIDYPIVIKDSKDLVSYPIFEQSDKIKVYFGCSTKSGNAEDIVKSINNIIDTNEQKMTKFYTDYLSKEQQKSYK